jgi:hypothetical protein
MTPTLQDIRVDTILSNVSVAYKNEEYIAEKVLPVIQVATATGKYYIYDKSSFKKERSERGMGSVTNEVGYNLSQSAAYVIKEHALMEIVPDELIDQSPAPLNPEMDATENVTEKLMVEKEYDLATWMKDTNNITNYRTFGSEEKWSVVATATPLTAVMAAKVTLQALIFKTPNTLLLGQQVYDQLVLCTTVIDRIKYAQLGVVTTELLARLFGVDQVLIGKAGYETATEGQTSSLSYIWGKYAWLLYVTPRPGIKQVSFGYHFQDKPRVVDKWYDKPRKGTFVRVTDRYVREIVDANCAYMFSSVVA